MLEWKVWKYDCNAKQMVQCNALSGFETIIANLRENCESKADFANRLDKEFLYKYYLRSQYEIILKPWACRDDATERKIDIYEQLKMNWDAVVEKCWYDY